MEFTLPWSQAKLKLPAEVGEGPEAEVELIYNKAFTFLQRKTARTLTPALWRELFSSIDDLPDPTLLILNEILFRGFDRNKDGVIDAVEYLEGILALMSPGPARLALFIGAIDSDNDGLITPADLRIFYLAFGKAATEMHNVPPVNAQGLPVHLQRCDQCGAHPIVGPRFVCLTCAEDMLDTVDLCSRCKGSDAVATNHAAHQFEAYLARESPEASADAVVAKTFSKVDRDRDGRISLQDCLAFPPFFQLMSGGA